MTDADKIEASLTNFRAALPDLLSHALVRDRFREKVVAFCKPEAEADLRKSVPVRKYTDEEGEHFVWEGGWARRTPLGRLIVEGPKSLDAAYVLLALIHDSGSHVVPVGHAAPDDWWTYSSVDSALTPLDLFMAREWTNTLKWSMHEVTPEAVDKLSGWWKTAEAECAALQGEPAKSAPVPPTLEGAQEKGVALAEPPPAFNGEVANAMRDMEPAKNAYNVAVAARFLLETRYVDRERRLIWLCKRDAAELGVGEDKLARLAANAPEEDGRKGLTANRFAELVGLQLRGLGAELPLDWLFMGRKTDTPHAFMEFVEALKRALRAVIDGYAMARKPDAPAIPATAEQPDAPAGGPVHAAAPGEAAKTTMDPVADAFKVSDDIIQAHAANALRSIAPKAQLASIATLLPRLPGTPALAKILEDGKNLNPKAADFCQGYRAWHRDARGALERAYQAVCGDTLNALAKQTLEVFNRFLDPPDPEGAIRYIESLLSEGAGAAKTPGGAAQSDKASVQGAQHEPPPEGVWQALFGWVWRFPPWLKWPIIILTAIVLVLFALCVALPDATKQRLLDWIMK